MGRISEPRTPLPSGPVFHPQRTPPPNTTRLWPTAGSAPHAVIPVTLVRGLTGPSSSFLSGSPEQQKALWLEQLLQLVQKKNSLVAEEAELMIT